MDRYVELYSMLQLHGPLFIDLPTIIILYDVYISFCRNTDFLWVHVPAAGMVLVVHAHTIFFLFIYRYIYNPDHALLYILCYNVLCLTFARLRHIYMK